MIHAAYGGVWARCNLEIKIYMQHMEVCAYSLLYEVSAKKPSHKSCDMYILSMILCMAGSLMILYIHCVFWLQHCVNSVLK